MNSHTPTWYYGWDIFIKLLGIIGGIALFLWVTKPSAESERASKEMEARLADVNARITAATEQFAVERSRAESELAKLQAEKQGKPQLDIIPSIEEIPSYLDVREVRLRLTVKNIGLPRAHIDKIEIDAFMGQLSADAMDVVNRTQEIAQCLQVMSRMPVDEQQKSDYDAASARYLELGRKCPHGQLFLVGEESRDVKWKPVERAHAARFVDLDLEPGQNAFEQATFLLTEDLGHNAGWLRFAVTVSMDHTQSRYTFVVPTRNVPVTPTAPAKYTSYVVSSAGGSQERAVYHWTPEASLIPRSGAEPEPVSPPNITITPCPIGERPSPSTTQPTLPRPEK